MLKTDPISFAAMENPPSARNVRLRKVPERAGSDRVTKKEKVDVCSVCLPVYLSPLSLSIKVHSFSLSVSF